MAEKTDKQKQDEAKRREEARAKSVQNLQNILTAPGRVMEGAYGAVVDAGVGFVDKLQYEESLRELRTAELEYNRNPTDKNKKRLETAKKEERTEKKKYEQKQSGAPVTSEAQGSNTYTDRPSNAAGQLVTPSGLTGADNPAERAKSTAVTLAPNYIPINPLDNNRWKNAFAPTYDEYDSVYWNQDDSMVPVSFFPNSVGAIYQKENAPGTPESLDAAVTRIAKQYGDTGKMNELRSLLISSGVASNQEEINALTRVQGLEGSGYMQLDGNTLRILKKAVSLGTKINAAAVDSGQKAQTFEQFINVKPGTYSSYFNNGSTNGSGTPRRTVSIQKQVFTPEELELNIDAFFQEYTGQGASKEDVDFLVKRLNSLSPQKTVSTRSGNTTTSTTTGGVSQGEQQLAMREMALQSPDAESYNKATTYLNYFREALASPIELG